LPEINCFIVANTKNDMKIFNNDNFCLEAEIKKKNDVFAKFMMFTNGKQLLSTNLNNKVHVRLID
jgi:hypothetical protein